VTPAQKDSTEPKAVVAGLKEPGLEAIPGARAAADGGRMAWDSEYVLPGSSTFGVDYLSTRTRGGWSTEGVVPPQSVENGLLCPFDVGMVGWSMDLKKGVLADGYGQEPENGESYANENLECGHDEPRLAAGELEGFQNLFLRSNEEKTYQIVNVTPHGVVPPRPSENPFGPTYFPASFLAGATDLSHVVFEDELRLTPEAPPGDDLYEWTGGAVRLVTVLPNGNASPGMLAGATKNVGLDEGRFVPINLAGARHAVSADGQRIYFEAAGKLYLRENGQSTAQVDAARGAGPGGGGQFMGASETGDRVFFIDDAAAGLTADTLPNSGANLYEYDVTSGGLTDLTRASTADVLGVSGISQDGSIVYFVAEGALAPGAPPGEANLYAERAGEVAFIATLSRQADACDWTTNTGCTSAGNPPETSGLTARVSASGRYMAFTSLLPLTNQPNIDAVTGEKDPAVFRYDAESRLLSCASCSPSGAAPVGPAVVRYPALPITDIMWREAYLQRNVTDHGQVFFETKNPLVPGDINGRTDVYEYTGAAAYLLSSCTSEADSYFLDASESGEDVFFATAQRLAARDEDTAYDIYDARVNGGFQEPAQVAPGCSTSEGCRPAVPLTAAVLAPGSNTFVGPGNSVSSVPPAAVKPKTAAQLRAKKLAKALEACRKKRNKHKRASCDKQAHKAYGTKKAKKASHDRRASR
jgi:hypothetical protein